MVSLRDVCEYRLGVKGVVHSGLLTATRLRFVGLYAANCDSLTIGVESKVCG